MQGRSKGNALLLGMGPGYPLPCGRKSPGWRSGELAWLTLSFPVFRSLISALLGKGQGKAAFLKPCYSQMLNWEFLQVESL